MRILRFAAVAAVLVPLAAGAGDLIGRVSFVTDGDTFWVRPAGVKGLGVKVRLWGIDAPERGTTAGKAARAALARLVEGQTVRCKRRDYDYKWRREVGQCFVPAGDLAAILVRQGHARDWPRYSKGYYRFPK